MIKFSARHNERQTLGFGLSRENVNRLIAGKPIHVHLEEMGLSGTEIIIFFGETEEAMQKGLADMMSDKTAVHVDPKLKM